MSYAYEYTQISHTIFFTDTDTPGAPNDSTLSHKSSVAVLASLCYI